MKTIDTLFEEQFRKIKERGWEHIYVIVDMHDTVFKSTYGNDQKLIPYDLAVDCLMKLSYRKDVKLIYWSSTNETEQKRHLEYLSGYNINFDYINENPEEASTSYADFDKKFYMNVILDDKAGFDPNEDWFELYLYLM